MDKVTARRLSDPVEAYRFEGDNLQDVEWLLDELTSHGGEPSRPMLGIVSGSGNPKLYIRTSGVSPKLVLPGMWVLIYSPVGRWDVVSDETFRNRYEALP